MKPELLQCESRGKAAGTEPIPGPLSAVIWETAPLATVVWCYL